MDINLRLTFEIQQEIKKEIEEAGGNEVFFRGSLNEDGIVENIQVVARGNKYSVPAILGRMKREEVIIHNHPSGYIYPSDADIEVATENIQVVARGNKYSVPAILGRMKREEVIIHNHPSGYIYPSDADIEVATVFANKMNGGFYIVNNSVTDIYVVIEPYSEKNKKIEITPYFEENGIISQNFKEFEFREEQLSMARHIEEGINNEKKIVVEAGTGTGKTLAYLIPAIEWAVTNEKRVIISTNTINLQEQLLNKDIPMLQKIMEKKFRYALVKGRGNYLCNRKFYNIKSGKNKEILELSEEQQNHLRTILEQQNHLRTILEWGRETTTGDKSELNIEPDYTVWEMFQSESDLCFSGCPHREECFFFKARDEKKRADILIANHHIFFSDLAIKKQIGFNNDYSILPEYSMAVFDEAHNVENVARDYFSYEVSRYSFSKSMNKILNVAKIKDENLKQDIKLFEIENESIKIVGQLKEIISIIKNSDIGESQEALEIIDKEFIKSHINLYNHGIKYFERLIEVFSKGQNGNISIRIKKDDVATENYFKMVEDFRENFILEFSEYLRIVKKIRDLISEIDDINGKINEFLKYLERVESFYEKFQFINIFVYVDFIYLIEGNERKKVEKVARDYFSYEVSRYSFSKSMNKILNVAKIKDENLKQDIKLFEIENESIKIVGQLKEIISIIKNSNIGESQEALEIIDKEFIKSHIDLYNHGMKYFERLIEVFSKGQNGNISIRIKKDDVATENYFKMVEDFRENFTLEFSEYLKIVKKIRDLISEIDDINGKINEFLKYLERVESFYENFQFINRFEDEDFIYWIEVNERKNNAKLVATPLKVDGELSENLYDNLKQIIFTSATLSVGNNFDYFK